MSKQDKRMRKAAKDLYTVALEEVINPRLTSMENYVKEQLAKMADQQRKINGFVVGEVKYTISNELEDAKVTREALLEVLNEKLGVEGFAALIEARKPETRKRLVAEAEARMKEAQEKARAEAEAADQAKAASEQKAPDAVSAPETTESQQAAPSQG